VSWRPRRSPDAATPPIGVELARPLPIPIVGNVAEHLVAVEVALKNKMDLSLEIALASSLQIALFVAPVLVFVSLLFGQYLNLVFNQFELLALIGAVVISALVASDGETNWLEGAQRLGAYLILGVAFFLSRVRASRAPLARAPVNCQANVTARTRAVVALALELPRARCGWPPPIRFNA
jgi:hypothetical protein